MINILSRYKCIWKEAIGILIMIIPILIFAGVSMPAADDFSNAVNTLEYWNKYPNSYIAVAVKTFDLYFSTGGYFFAAYLNFFFSPMLRFGINGIRIFNVLAHIFFFMSAYYMISSFVKNVFIGGLKEKWLLLFLFLFSLINTYSNSEVYTWYCVMAAYVLPVACMFIMVGLFIRSCYTSNILTSVLAAIIGFLVSGSSLNITVLNCEVAFLIGAYGYYILGRKKEVCIVLLFVLFGAVINGIAPGNYVRHDLVQQDYSVWMPIINSVLVTLMLLIKKIFLTLFIPISVLAFIVIYNYCNINNVITNVITRVYHPIHMLVFIFIGVVLVNFPVVFGYGTYEIPDRCVFVQDIALYLFGFLWIINFVGWVKDKYAYESINLETIKEYYGNIKLQKKGLIASVICSYYVLVFFFLPMTTIQMVSSIGNNTLKDYIIYEQDIIREIENSDSDVIRIERSYKQRNRYVMDLGISEDSSSWINRSLCAFYNKRDISIHYNNYRNLRGIKLLEYIFYGNTKGRIN